MNFKTVTLENNFLKVKIIPTLGGRIDSLVYKKTNKEWVWNNKYLQKSIVKKEVNYDSNWQGGWEELFPNDAIETFSWGKGLDHGELWSASWKIKNYSENYLDLIVDKLDSGSIFKKSISIDKNVLSVSYKCDIKFNDFFLFKLHLAVPLTKYLRIECDYKNISSVDKNFGNILRKNEDFFVLNRDSKLFDFAYLDLNEKQVALVDEDKNLLELHFAGDLDYFWIFQTQGGWNNHNVIVLEPASNSKKILSEAINENGALKGPRKFKCDYKIFLDTKRTETY